MSGPVIEVKDLSKQYRLGTVGTGTLVHDVNRWWHKMMGKEDPYLMISETNDRTQKGGSEYVWSLKDISFSINKGDVVGIIGRNGAGKSTLLKILSRTTAPTTGSVKVKGRVASLLEVGTGFHPELTGRENIFLNGAILGMTKKEIKTKFDEIVDFSGVERYIDTPVKRYSSGMYVRLAFAVAAHLESEILIVDEVLAVGDAEFQKKCLGKMDTVSKGEGKTILFVSHNMAVISSLCHTGILLNKGEIESTGNIKTVIGNYFRKAYDLDHKPLLNDFRTYKIETAPAFFTDISVIGSHDGIPKIGMGQEVVISLKIRCRKPVQKASVLVMMYDAEGICTALAYSWDDSFFLSVDNAGDYEILFRPSVQTLSPGRYTIGAGLSQTYQENAWDGINYYPLLEIENQNQVIHWNERPWGINHLEGNSWSVKEIKAKETV